jgi:hypothetical protein
MVGHREVPVRVNAFVDEGIAELVATLNDFPSVQTLQSCQGGSGREAYVFLKCEDWKSTCEFLFGKIAPALREKIDEESLRLEVFGNVDPVGKIAFQPESMAEITSEIKRLVQ